MGFRLPKKSIKCQPISDIPVQNENITAILNLFPEYSDLFLKTHKTLMSGNGSLPTDHRHYISMMACTIFSCETLISIEERSFLASGGDQAWLHDPERVPAKLKRLSEVNNLLAETPWLVKPHHIKVRLIIVTESSPNPFFFRVSQPARVAGLFQKLFMH